MTKADWLRSEIEKLEGDLRPYNSMSDWAEEINAHNTALTSIITRYKEELKVLESK